MWTNLKLNNKLIFCTAIVLTSLVWTVSAKSSDNREFDGARSKKIAPEIARYAINFIPGFEGGNSSSNNNNNNMAAGAIVEMMSHIRDPFKHGVTSSVLAGLYIVALISLIVFAITGAISFICSFSDCGNFFLGMKADGSPRPLGGGGPVLFKRRDYPHHNNWVNELQPEFQTSLHESYEKFGKQHQHE